MNLRLHRLRLGMRQADVAKYLGITEGAYNRYESGTRTPRPKHAIKLAALYGVGLNEIYKEEDESAEVHDDQ